MADRNIIGKRLKLARRNSKPPVTQSDLAARLQLQGLNFDRVTIAKIETSYREVTDIEVKELARALGVTIAWLYGESDKTKK